MEEKIKILHTNFFDDKLKLQIKHLNNYPQMLPFVGNKWLSQSRKILLLGESHFIPVSGLEQKNITDWYNNTSEKFNKDIADYIFTRNVINKADNVKDEGFEKPLTIFYNIKTAMKDNIAFLKNESQIFPFLSFYNYFQKPCFVIGGSIQNNEEDDEIAYQTLKAVVNIIEPSLIIFVSTKAKKSFEKKMNWDDEKECFKNITIDGVPHPSCKWWNTKAKPYGDLTGKEKFISLIK